MKLSLFRIEESGKTTTVASPINAATIAGIEYQDLIQKRRQKEKGRQ